MKSRNAALDDGATDGKYRKVRPNTTVAPLTGGEIMTANRRTLLADIYDTINDEAPAKVNPGSR